MSEDKIWFCSGWTGKEAEGAASCWTEGRARRWRRGGTGGTAPPVSDRDKLRVGLIFSAWLRFLLGVVILSSRSESDLLLGLGMSLQLNLSNTKQMDSWESLRGGGGAGSGAGQKLMGAVLRRLKTVLGLGTGFTTALLESEFANIAVRFGAELFLSASKFTVPVDWLRKVDSQNLREEDTDWQRSRGRSDTAFWPDLWTSSLWMWLTRRRILFLCPVAVTPRLTRASWSKWVKSLANRRAARRNVSTYLRWKDWIKNERI